jgi:hypothetical protein
VLELLDEIQKLAGLIAAADAADIVIVRSPVTSSS